MKRFRIASMAVCVLALLVSLASGAEEKVSLKLRLTAGQKYYQRVTVAQEISQTVGGRKMDMTQKMIFGFASEVLEGDERSIYTIRLTYSSVGYVQQNPMGKVEYDSEHPPEDIPLQVQPFASLVGQSFTMQVTPQGRVKNVTGCAQIVKKMVADMKKAVKDGNIPNGEAIIKALEKAVGGQFGDDAMRESMESMTAFYPEYPVAIGDSWSHTINAKARFAMKIENIWKLKERRNGVATVQTFSKISSIPDSPATDMGFGKMKFEMNGKQEGIVKIDEATGLELEAETSQELTGTLSIEPTKTLPDGMKMPMTIVSKITIEPTEPPAPKKKKAVPAR